jgi:hypothetical protein
MTIRGYVNKTVIINNTTNNVVGKHAASPVAADEAAAGFYVWHRGYWGPRIGFYGGCNYGYGYYTLRRRALAIALCICRPHAACGPARPYPGAGHPVVVLAIIIPRPVPRHPDIARSRNDWLDTPSSANDEIRPNDGNRK